MGPWLRGAHMCACDRVVFHRHRKLHVRRNTKHPQNKRQISVQVGEAQQDVCARATICRHDKLVRRSKVLVKWNGKRRDGLDQNLHGALVGNHSRRRLRGAASLRDAENIQPPFLAVHCHSKHSQVRTASRWGSATERVSGITHPRLSTGSARTDPVWWQSARSWRCRKSRWVHRSAHRSVRALVSTRRPRGAP